MFPNFWKVFKNHLPSVLNCVLNMLDSMNILLVLFRCLWQNPCNLQESQLVKIKSESFFLEISKVNTLNIKLLQDILCEPMQKGVPWYIEKSYIV